MQRTTRPLTNAEVLRSKAIDKDMTHHDGDGLYMVVKTAGKKRWRFRYQRPATKQRTMMGLGAFPALSLAYARRLHSDYLSLLANGIDPQTQAEQATEQQQIALDSIFSTVAANWFTLKQANVRISGDLLRKMFFLPLLRYRCKRLKPVSWLKRRTQLRPVVLSKLFAV